METGKFDYIRDLMRQRILVLDGAMGSMLQSCRHKDEESAKLPDLYVRDNPRVVKEIHKAYLEAGADIIETDSFNANRFALSDYGLENEAYTLAFEAAKLAREAVDEFKCAQPRTKRFVAGSVGPTKLMLSMTDSTSEFNFDSLAEAYTEQIRGLIDGGADIILLETIFDTLTAKAALYAVSEIERERNEKIPVVVSCTVDASSGRLLSGQTIEAFYASVRHAGLLAVGLNCGFGSESVLPYLRRLSEVADTGISVYPNAGLPDDCGEYHEDACTFALNLQKSLRERLVNIVGGCCGTTPEHIKELKETVEKFQPRPIPERHKRLILSNLEYYDAGASKELIQVGERTNVAGSAKFARLIREKNFDEALEIATRQVKAGAGIVDVCMDDGMEDAGANMEKFLRLFNSDSDTGVVPVMIDSSEWTVVVRALKANQGKGIVNSISLKDGESEFVRKAEEIRRLGAAVVVMLFDEKGQAETYERKIEIAERAYNLLLESGFPPEDIMFDPNVLTLGLEKRDSRGLDFIKAVAWIKANLPSASVSGGISNLSFAFRGNNPIREAMHTAFLTHAVKAGLDMAIVNAGMIALYDDIDKQLLEAIEDLILCREENAVDKVIVLAQKREFGTGQQDSGTEESSLPIADKLYQALAKGRDKEMEALMKEALETFSPMSIIDDILMPGMKKIGEMFGEGRMFLPQVIKVAQAMKKGVSVITPYLDASEIASTEKKRLVIATVKGDVHDIGKNIVALVASCNGYEVEDLGVRVDENQIAAAVENAKPVALLLSGLIAPSLNEMTKVCRELDARGIRVPVIIGGAATSEIHTAVKIAPEYSGCVFYSPDASANLRILQELSPETEDENRRRQEELRKLYFKTKNESIGENHVKENSVDVEPPIRPREIKRVVLNGLPLEEVERFIDWNMLSASLGLLKKGVDENNKEEVLEEAHRLFGKIKKEKSLQIEGVVGVYKAVGNGNEIIVYPSEDRKISLPMQRASKGRDAGLSVADFLNSDEDYVALFAVSAGKNLKALENSYSETGDIFHALLCKLIADRLTEASAEWVHDYVANELWGFAEKDRKGIRIAFGYPSAPDHNLKRTAFEIMEVSNDTSMTLTENSMIVPGESVCGIILSSGRFINAG